MAWIPRQNKTQQDLMPVGDRQRVRDWDKRRSFMANHKPARSTDWLKLRKND